MKTACEEAADKFEAAAEWLDVPALDDFSGLPKRLRDEGRELKRLRNGILAMQKIPYGHQPDWDFIYREAIRIKKARKTK